MKNEELYELTLDENQLRNLTDMLEYSVEEATNEVISAAHQHVLAGSFQGGDRTFDHLRCWSSILNFRQALLRQTQAAKHKEQRAQHDEPGDSRLGDSDTIRRFHGIPWTSRDSAIAENEGWNIFESDSWGYEIQPDDEAAQFANDEIALSCVVDKAVAGSRTHLKALLITVQSWCQAYNVVP